MFAGWVGSSAAPWSRSAVVRHHPDFRNTEGWKAAHHEANVPKSRYEQELREGLEKGLPGASSIQDRTIPTFCRGELPHFAGIVRPIIDEDEPSISEDPHGYLLVG